MWKASVCRSGGFCPALAALTLVWLIPGLANAVELKNVRAVYGYSGPARADTKFQPGDFVCLVFDIAELKVDPKKFQVSYKIVADFMDSRGSIEKKETPQEGFLGLGGNSMPGVVIFPIRDKQGPGKYRVKLTVTDRNAKKTKTHDFPLEVVAPEFGIVQVVAPAVVLPGMSYDALFHFVNMGLDGKKKPKVSLSYSILDEGGKPVVPAAKLSFPDDLPPATDLQKDNFVPQKFPVYCNRAGRFTILIDGHDKIADKRVQLRIPLVVLDLAQIGKTAVSGTD
jgi:hypothetical protein